MKWALILACALSLIGQDARFGVNSRLVVVPVTVTDKKGHTIDGLDAVDFQLLDEGRAQRVTVDTMATGVAPIALVIAVESAGISIPALERIRKIGSMIQPLITGERGCAAVVSFAQRVTWLQECTNDADAIARAFHGIEPGEYKEAHLLDAAQAAIVKLRGRPNSRRVLLLISESKDRGSETDLSMVTFAAQSVGVTVYAATFSAFKTGFLSKSQTAPPTRAIKPVTPNDNMNTIDGNPPSIYNPKIPPPEQRIDLLGGMRELARVGKANDTQVLTEITGGTSLSFSRQGGLEDAIEKLGRDLNTQYVLSFVPEAPTPGFHAVKVSLNRRGDFRLRARPGYWSSQ